MSSNQKKISTLILLILSSSFALKFGLQIFLSRSQNYWQTGYSFYYRTAQNFLNTGTLYLDANHSLYEAPKLYAVRPPIYPIFIALVNRLTNHSAVAFILIECLISSGTVLFVYQMTKLLADKRAALASAFLCAFYPYALFHDSQLQENVVYNFFSTFSVLLLLFGIKREKSSYFFLTGTLLGLATLTRASHLIHGLVLIFFLPWLFKKSNLKEIGKFFLLGLLGFSLVLAPWILRNKRATGAWTLTSLTGGALAEAHNPYTFLYYLSKSIDLSTARFKNELIRERHSEIQNFTADEMTQSKWYEKIAIDYITTHPFETAKRGIIKIAVNFLGILSPLQGFYKNLIFFLSYWFLTLLFIRAVPQIKSSAFLKIFLLLSLSQAIFSFTFWAHTSHRSFLDPLLAVGAGIGLASILSNGPKL